MSPFFEVFFMSLRLVFSFVHSQFDKIIIYIKSLFDWKQRSLWEENDSNFSKIVNKYLALSSEVRGVLLSDIKWSIKKFEDPVVDTKGKIAVITGADQELGRTSAQAMAKLGLKV